MKRMIKYPSIEQFRTIIKNVQHAAQYVRYDEATGQTIMNRGAAMPKVTAVATEKIHGTNASVCYSIPDGFWIQKREENATTASYRFFEERQHGENQYSRSLTSLKVLDLQQRWYAH